VIHIIPRARSTKNPHSSPGRDFLSALCVKQSLLSCLDRLLAAVFVAAAATNRLRGMLQFIDRLSEPERSSN
jgi:hypothetical protein